MKNKLLGLTLVVCSFFQGCGVIPVPYKIKDGYARVENWTQTTKSKVSTHKEWQENNYDDYEYPYTKETLDMLFVMCFKQKARGFFRAYQYPAGKHNIWTKAVYNGKEADILFNVNLAEGGNYALKQRLYKNRMQVDVWMIDQETQKAISPIHVVPMKRFKVYPKKSIDKWNARCLRSSV